MSKLLKFLLFQYLFIIISSQVYEDNVDLDMYQCEKVQNPEKLDDCGESPYGYCCMYTIKVKGKQPFKGCVTSPFPEYYGKTVREDDETAWQSHELVEEGFAVAKRDGYVLDYMYCHCPKKDIYDGEKSVRCGDDYYSGDDGFCHSKSEGEDI